MPRTLLLLGLGICISAAGPSRAEGFRVIGHRGAAGSAPENTLAALQRARELGVREVEVDLRLSRDGQLVLFHDRTLGEKTDLKGRVDAHDLATLVTADIGSWFDRSHPNSKKRYAGTRVIPPGAAFERHGEAFFWHLEIKSNEPELPALLIAAIRAAKLEQRAMVTSFNQAQLLRVRALAAGIPLCRLIHGPGLGRPTPESVIESAAAHGFAMVGIAAKELSAAHVERGHALGLEVRAFGIRSDAQLARVIALGADGATVDHPDRAFALLARDASPSP